MTRPDEPVARLVSGRAHGRTIGQILLTWVTTLPLGFALGDGVYLLLAA